MKNSNITRNTALYAAAGSLAMLLGAFAFQYIGGMAPCELCIWQRWPHGIAIALGVIIYFVPNRSIAFLGALVVLAGAGIAFFHAGVELKYWAGPDTCTGLPDLGTLSVEALWSRPVVRCDDIPWSMWGISMAGWNGIISLGLAAIWGFSLRAKN
ncbi:MAG: disulfide bond formation protein B [Rhodobacteraceae bacterium]|nr:disulfide bond formation protein B [Paracoccaceae bacterium]